MKVINIIIRFVLLLGLISFSIAPYAKITSITLLPSNSVTQGSMVTVSVNGSGNCTVIVETNHASDVEGGFGDYTLGPGTLPVQISFQANKTGTFQIAVTGTTHNQETCVQSGAFAVNTKLHVVSKITASQNKQLMLIEKKPSFWFDTSKRVATKVPSLNGPLVFGVNIHITNQGIAANDWSPKNRVSITTSCISLTGGQCKTLRLPPLPIINPGQSRVWGNLNMFSVNKAGKYKITLNITPATKIKFDKHRQLITANLKQTWSKEFTIQERSITTPKAAIKQSLSVNKNLSVNKQKKMGSLKQGEFIRQRPEPSSIRLLLEEKK